MKSIFLGSISLTVVLAAVSCRKEGAVRESGDTGHDIRNPSSQGAEEAIALGTKSKSRPTANISSNDSQFVNGLSPAFYEANKSGRFDLYGDILSKSSQSVRDGILRAEIYNVKSPLGPRHDLEQTLVLIEKFGGPSKSEIRDQALRNFGGRLNSLEDLDYAKATDDESWKTIVTGFSDQDPQMALEKLATPELPTKKLVDAVNLIIKDWLALDSVEASNHIGKMSAGPVRDLAISNMVDWLIDRGDPSSAEQWADSILDVGKRDSVKEKIGRSQSK